MRILILGAAALVAGALLVAPAVSAPKTITLTAKLKGTKEVPGPGDADGKGKAVIRLKRAKERVCFNITVNRIAGATAGHIHVGGKDDAGGIVVPLFAFATPSDDKELKGCVDADREVIDEIAADPRGYYVNVHNADFPNGAVRGQLRKKPRKS